MIRSLLSIFQRTFLLNLILSKHLPIKLRVRNCSKKFMESLQTEPQNSRISNLEEKFEQKSLEELNSILEKKDLLADYTIEAVRNLIKSREG